MNTDLALIILGSLIPLLTTVFVTNLLDWERDRAADRESAIADRETLWHLDWAFWRAAGESDNLTIRRLAHPMQGFLAANRPEEI